MTPRVNAFDNRFRELDAKFVDGIWEGTLDEAAELLGVMPKGERRRELKQAIFHLIYGGPSSIRERTSLVDPQVDEWWNEHQELLARWGKKRDDSEHKHRWEPWGSYGDARCSEAGCPVVRTWKGEVFRPGES